MLNIVNLFPEIKNGNEYILIAIRHYSKWCKVKIVHDHIATTTAKLLGDEIICQFGVPKCILTNNGKYWAGQFGNLCKVYGIQHKFTTPKWPCYNGMAEWMIKTIKHGIIVLFRLPKYAKSWDLQL